MTFFGSVWTGVILTMLSDMKPFKNEKKKLPFLLQPLLCKRTLFWTFYFNFINLCVWTSLYFETIFTQNLQAQYISEIIATQQFASTETDKVFSCKMYFSNFLSF